MIKKVVSIILVLVWMVLIFGFSNQNGEASGGLTEELISSVVEILTNIEKNSDEMINIVETLSFPVRKCAHFFIYYVLAFLIMNALNIWGIKKKTVIIASLISILFSITDEVHQLYIEDRSGQISDVLLDSSASLLSSYLYHRFVIMRGMNEKNSD